ncbi:MAG: hypothetical protein ACR2FJ_08325 [Qipengyuania sp.]
MSKPETRFSNTKRKPRPAVIVLIAIIHVAIFYGLLRALAPGTVQSVERSVVSAFEVTITTPEEPPKEDEPDEGMQGDPGKQAIPSPVTAPSPKKPIARETPAPKAASTGTAPSSGAREAGAGTGAAGSGPGTGSGNAGKGSGGGIATRPTVRSGSINSARDFPVPPGGRSVRDGTSVTVVFTVGVNGRASDCSVSNPGPDPATNALVCPLVIERIRFNPARDAQGNPVPARYGWRQDFFRSR